MAESNFQKLKHDADKLRVLAAKRSKGSVGKCGKCRKPIQFRGLCYSCATGRPREILGMEQVG